MDLKLKNQLIEKMNKKGEIKMDFIELSKQRRSIRKFTEQEIHDEIIEQLLISAMAAPSARNMQPWEFHVIKNKEIQNQIKNSFKNYDFNSTLTIVVCGNKERTLTQNDNDFWIQDCSAAVENILLAATSLGLGAVWCGAFPVIERSEKVRTIINVEENIVPMAVIQLGYPNEDKEDRTQYNKEFVHYL
jgi:nitroreductase